MSDDAAMEKAPTSSLDRQALVPPSESGGTDPLAAGGRAVESPPASLVCGRRVPPLVLAEAMWELCRSRSDIHCFDVLKVCPHFPPFRDRAPYFALVTSLNKSWMRVRWLPQCNDKEVVDKSQGAYVTSWLKENDIFRRV